MAELHKCRKRPTPAAGGFFKAAICLLACAVVLAGTGTVRGQGPRPGKHPLDHQNRLRPHATDRCPVCAMRPVKHPRFAAALQMQDGATFYFCSAGCMLKAWLRPAIFLGAGPDDLKQPVAQDYFSGQPVDARAVFWISGSDVIGPMGPALVPLQQSAHVETFRRRHGAKSVFRLEDLNEDNWKALTGKPFRF